MTQPTNDDLVSGKAYAGAGVTVYYDARRCVRGLPKVFRPQERPWIQVGAAQAQAVAAVVRGCPTGALHYVLDGAGPEEPDDITTITPRPDGLLMIRGNLLIHTPGGQRREVRAALRRCGQSGNKPYCDGIHREVGWSSGEAEQA